MPSFIIPWMAATPPTRLQAHWYIARITPISQSLPHILSMAPLSLMPLLNVPGIMTAHFLARFSTLPTRSMMSRFRRIPVIIPWDRFCASPAPAPMSFTPWTEPIRPRTACLCRTSSEVKVIFIGLTPPMISAPSASKPWCRVTNSTVTAAGQPVLAATIGVPTDFNPKIYAGIGSTMVIPVVCNLPPTSKSSLTSSALKSRP